jgi:hypothetical protein
VQRCAREELSCAAFGVFVWLGRWGAAPREPARAHFAKLFKGEQRSGRGGLRPATRAKFEALRALRGTYPSVAAALDEVGLSLTYWQRIMVRDAALAAHVQSLVVPRARGR